MEDNKVWFKPTQPIKYNKDKDIFGVAVFDFETKEMRVYDAELVEMRTAARLIEEEKKENAFFALTENFNRFSYPALDYVSQYNDVLADIILVDLIKQFTHYRDVTRYPYSREKLVRIYVDFYYYVYNAYCNDFCPIFYDDRHSFLTSLEDYKAAVENYERLFNYKSSEYYKDNIIAQYVRNAIESSIFIDAAQ